MARAKVRQRQAPLQVSVKLLLRLFILVCLTSVIITLVTLYNHEGPSTSLSMVPPPPSETYHSLLSKNGINPNKAHHSSNMSSMLENVLHQGKVFHRNEQEGPKTPSYEKPKYTVTNTITAQDLGLTVSDDEVATAAGKDGTNDTSLIDTAKQDKQYILQLLLEAGIEYLDFPTLQQLPTIRTIQEMYSKEAPIIHGLDQCQAFRQKVPPSKITMGSAGIFNSGTNVLYALLEGNCQLPNHYGVQWQVPWGKHMLASLRDENTAKMKIVVDKEHVLPIVIVRDPYIWMQRMCRHPYAVMWHHSDNHCPNLVPNQHDYKLYHFPGNNIPVRIKAWKPHFGGKQAPVWKSMAHLWTDWYQQYYNWNTTENPRVMIRLEDLIFYPKQVVSQLCDCVGGTMPENVPFNYMVDSAKVGSGHGTNKTSLVGAMMQYKSHEQRLKGYTSHDLHLANIALDPILMDAFHYTRPLGNESVDHQQQERLRLRQEIVSELRQHYKN